MIPVGFYYFMPLKTRQVKRGFRIMAYLDLEKRRQYNKQYFKKWYQENKEKGYRVKGTGAWIKRKVEEKRAWSRNYYHTKEKLNPKFRVDSAISGGIRFALKGKKAGRHWETLVGYSLQNLIKHLEKQFDNKMSWDNYGSYWQIDHIKPKASFNYTCPEDLEFQECWSLVNLQPLERIANWEKGWNYP